MLNENVINKKLLGPFKFQNRIHSVICKNELINCNIQCYMKMSLAKIYNRMDYSKFGTRFVPLYIIVYMIACDLQF